MIDLQASCIVSSKLCIPSIAKRNFINECTTTDEKFMDNCDQECTNTIGSYSCSCQDGYMLQEDGTSCEGENATINLFADAKHAL